MKRSTLLMLAVVAALSVGCASYKEHAPKWGPDGCNYSVQVDHKTGETSSYVGVSWNLK